MKASYLWRNCFVLLLPILLVNLLFAGRLPPAFQAEVFWADIPPWIGVPENVLRLLVMIVPALMPLQISSPIERTGLLLFGVGSLAYFASWAALIVAPLSPWSTSAIGFLAPAYTPLLWLAGLDLIGERLVFRRFPYRRWMYGVIAVLFVTFHVTHAWIVWSNSGSPRLARTSWSAAGEGTKRSFEAMTEMRKIDFALVLRLGAERRAENA